MTAVGTCLSTKKRESGRTACGDVDYLQYCVGAGAVTTASKNTSMQEQGRRSTLVGEPVPSPALP
jgi:hypothetical protein